MSALLLFVASRALAGELYEVEFRSEYSASEDCESDDDGCFEREMAAWDRQIQREARGQCDSGDLFVRSAVRAKYIEGVPVADAVAQCERQEYVPPPPAPVARPAPSPAAAQVSKPAGVARPAGWFQGSWIHIEGGVCMALDLAAGGTGKFGVGTGATCTAAMAGTYRVTGSTLIFTRNGVDVNFTLDAAVGGLRMADGSPMRQVSGPPGAATKTATTRPGTTKPAPAAMKAAPTGRDWVSPTLGTMKWIPPGTFVMGSPESESGRERDETQHEVTLTKGFWMMEHEVTQGEWETVMGSNPNATSTTYDYGREGGSCDYFGRGLGSDLPVTCVDWDQASEFARRVSARDGVNYELPTEAQWEYAARGGSNGTYAGGNRADTVAWTVYNSSTIVPGVRRHATVTACVI